MNEGIYFADPELAFHVWVRERTGEDGYRWVLREAPLAPSEPPTVPVDGDAPTGP